MGKQCILLEYRIHISLVGRFIIDSLAHKNYIALIRMLKAADHTQRSRLATTRRTQQRNKLVVVNLILSRTVSPSKAFEMCLSSIIFSIVIFSPLFRSRKKKWYAAFAAYHLEYHDESHPHFPFPQRDGLHPVSGNHNGSESI